MTDAEIETTATRMFKVFDLNHEGKITKIEFITKTSARRGATLVNAKHWKQADTNCDGHLSFDEFKGSFKLANAQTCTRAAR